MEAFLNERSLDSQFSDFPSFVDALIRINRVLMRIAETNVEKHMFYDRALYYRTVIGQHIFASCLARMSDKSVRLQFKVLLQDRLRAVEWSLERLHTRDTYLWNNIDMVDSSVAELAERRLQQRCGLLLNFTPSQFPSGILLVAKNGAGSVSLDSINSESDFESWCSLVLGVSIFPYDPNCGRSPLDNETALHNRGRFQAIGLKNQGRQAYLERKTGHYFCVDNLHKHGAHLEVFNSNGDHIGEATLEGVIDRSKSDGSKNLYL
jgi:hypothetical protein